MFTAIVVLGSLTHKSRSGLAGWMYLGQYYPDLMKMGRVLASRGRRRRKCWVPMEWWMHLASMGAKATAAFSMESGPPSSPDEWVRWRCFLRHPSAQVISHIT